MPRGGSRNRSGPPADPQSLRSATRDFTAVALPREGHKEDPPPWPLTDASDRELEVWVEAWRTPQAAAWAQEPWRWRTVGQYVRWSVRMEARDAGASLGAVVVRLADQIGLTPAGLRENGWTISKDQVTAKRDEKPSQAKRTAGRASARDRLSSVTA